MALSQRLRVVAPVTLVLVTSFCWPASAGWTVRQDGPDVFGTTKVVSVADAGNSSLVIQCDDRDKLYIAYLMPKETFGGLEAREIPAEILLQIDGATPIQLDATTRSWNEKYVAISTEGRSAAVVGAIQSIKTAGRLVNVGVKLGDAKDSASFNTQGSTNAMSKVITGCKLLPTAGE